MTENQKLTETLLAERGRKFTDEELVDAINSAHPKPKEKEEDPLEKLIKERIEPIERQFEVLAKQYEDSMARITSMLESVKAEESKKERTPDPHITGTSAPTSAGDWKARMKSNNPAIRESVLRDIFGE